MRQVQVVAHRGSSGTYPEHTLAAFEAAVAEGADALECDVRLTRDGVLVCVHDRRVDRTSNGRGLVSTLELADLAELDFASWKRGAAPADATGQEAPDLDAGRVLTLDRLLQLVVDAGSPVQLHVETKHPTRYGGQVERALLQLLDRYGLARPPSRAESRIYVVSYALSSLRRVHLAAPTIPTVINTDLVLPWLHAGRLPPRVAGVGVALRAVRARPGFVRRVQAQRRRVHVFTVDEPGDVDFVAGLGVDAIISNRPTQVLERLATI
ncbi:MAG: glycerophosphodiester phosphodiesterase [Actinomycetota bacterium]|nr:glycerophosphodiester phosphodiesterase [Actinomycetota bacterium]